MKFKLAYFVVAWEIGNFIYAMYERKASSVKIEFQESLGKVTLYIDDSSFKQLDGQMAWFFVKRIYSFIAKKSNIKELKDKDDLETSTDFEGTLNEQDVSKLVSGFKFKIPLPKRKGLKYSYNKKKGNVYEITFGLISNDVKDKINDEISKIIECLQNDNNVIMDYSKDCDNSMNGTVDMLTLKDNLLKISLTDNENNDLLVKFDINDIDIKTFFKRFKVVNDNKIEKISEERKITKKEDDIPKNYINWD